MCNTKHSIQHSVSQTGTITVKTQLNDNVYNVVFDTPMTGDYVVIITPQYVKGVSAWGWTQQAYMVYNIKQTGFSVDIFVPNSTYAEQDIILHWAALPTNKH